MPGILEQNWGNLNEQRNFPLDDSATCIASNGERLPENILVGASIWWPSSYGAYLYVTNVTVSPNLITLTFSTSAASNLDTPSGTAIAAVAIPRPHTAFKNYVVQPLSEGVGGWVSLGTGPDKLDTVKSWAFATPRASFLLSKAAHAYAAWPVTSVGAAGDIIQLYGAINIEERGDLTVTEGLRLIDGTFKRCIVVGLNENLLPTAYETYAGLCGTRPENANCPQGTPIASIGGLLPDCDGEMCFTLGNMLEGVKDTTEDTVGAIVAPTLDQSALCPADSVALTIFDHTFPCVPTYTENPLGDLCFSSSEEEEPCEEVSSSESSSSSSSYAPIAGCDTLEDTVYIFEDPDELDDFNIVSGVWVIDSCERPSYSMSSGEYTSEESSHSPSSFALMCETDDEAILVADCTEGIMNDYILHCFLVSGRAAERNDGALLFGYQEDGSCHLLSVDPANGTASICVRYADGTIAVIGAASVIGGVLAWTPVAVHVADLGTQHVISAWVGTLDTSWAAPTLRVVIPKTTRWAYIDGPPGLYSRSATMFFDNLGMTSCTWTGAEMLGTPDWGTPSECAVLT